MLELHLGAHADVLGGDIFVAHHSGDGHLALDLGSAGPQQIALLECELVFGVLAQITALGGFADGDGVFLHFHVDELVQFRVLAGVAGLGAEQNLRIFPRFLLRLDPQRGETAQNTVEQISPAGIAQSRGPFDLRPQGVCHAFVNLFQAFFESLAFLGGEYRSNSCLRLPGQFRGHGCRMLDLIQSAQQACHQRGQRGDLHCGCILRALIEPAHAVDVPNHVAHYFVHQPAEQVIFPVLADDLSQFVATRGRGDGD